MVKAQTSLDKVVVTADGDGVVSHAGSALLVGLADRVGLTAALSAAMEPTRQRVSAHDPGEVLRDLAVMLADGGPASRTWARCAISPACSGRWRRTRRPTG